MSRYQITDIIYITESKNKQTNKCIITYRGRNRYIVIFFKNAKYSQNVQFPFGMEINVTVCLRYKKAPKLNVIISLSSSLSNTMVQPKIILCYLLSLWEGGVSEHLGVGIWGIRLLVP